jgi:hypothetical protein
MAVIKRKLTYFAVRMWRSESPMVLAVKKILGLLWSLCHDRKFRLILYLKGKKKKTR